MTFIALNGTANATCYFNQKVLEKKQEIVLTYETNIINDDVLAIKSRYLFVGPLCDSLKQTVGIQACCSIATFYSDSEPLSL
jgi:hypothetical protein